MNCYFYILFYKVSGHKGTWKVKEVRVQIVMHTVVHTDHCAQMVFPNPTRRDA